MVRPAGAARAALFFLVSSFALLLRADAGLGGSLLRGLPDGPSPGTVAAIEVARELSSPGYEGRQAGSAGGIKAGDYIEVAFRSLGLPTTVISFRERAPVYVRAPRFSVSYPGGGTVELGWRKDYRDVVNGAWVEAAARGPLALLEGPGDSFAPGSILLLSSQGYDNGDDAGLLGRGAVGLLLVQDAAGAERRVAYPGTAPRRLAEPRSGLVKMVVSEERLPFFREAAAKGAVVELANPLGFEDRRCRDILASYDGDGKGFKPVFLFMAHYDHVGNEAAGSGYFPGALDNASGVGLLLALAADFARGDFGSDLAFLATDAEEINLSGAAAFASAPPFPLRGLRALNLDMVGDARPTRLSLYSNGDGPSLELGRRLEAFLRSRGIDCAQEFPVRNVDSGPLGEAGAAALTLCQYDETDYHSLRDRVEGLSARELETLEAALHNFVLSLPPR